MRAVDEQMRMELGNWCVLLYRTRRSNPTQVPLHSSVSVTRFREQIELEQSDTDSSSATLGALRKLVEFVLPP
jgi:hypothetical protein